MRPPSAIDKPARDRALNTAAAERPRARPSGWYVRHFVRARSTHRRAIAVMAAVAVAGCGGGARQDENEPDGKFEVEVAKATFPEKQKLGQSADLAITVRNTGSETVPNLAVTVNGFSSRSEEAGPRRPEPPAIRGERESR